MRLRLMVFLLSAVSAFAAHNNIAHTDVRAMAAVVVAASQTGHTTVFLRGQNATAVNDLLARGGLGVATDLSALVQIAGTSPNYRVEVLCSMDGVTFTKPEVGGILGVFTDTLPHFLTISCPLSPGGIELQFVELGGNQLTASSTLAGQ